MKMKRESLLDHIPKVLLLLLISTLERPNMQDIYQRMKCFLSILLLLVIKCLFWIYICHNTLNNSADIDSQVK